MNTITADFVILAAAVKNPWVIVCNLEVNGPYAGRAAARAAKADASLPGVVMPFKAEDYAIDAEVEVEAEVAEIVQISDAIIDAAIDAAIVDVETTKTKKVIAKVNVSTLAHPTKAVWHIADEMKEKGITKRGEVVAECIRRGIATYTARTQFQLWFQIQKVMAKREAGQ